MQAVRELPSLEVHLLVTAVVSLVFTTRNQKHHLEDNAIPAGHSHTNAHYACGVNNYLNSNHTTTAKYVAI